MLSGLQVYALLISTVAQGEVKCVMLLFVEAHINRGWVVKVGLVADMMVNEFFSVVSQPRPTY